MLAPSFIRSPGHPSTVASADEARELAGWILGIDRERPIVVVTALNDARDPYFAPGAVQRLVGLAGDVVAIEQRTKGRLTRELARALPDGLMVFSGAARIFWPVGLVGVDPEEHPLIRADSDATASAQKRARVTSRWRQGPGQTRHAVAQALLPSPGPAVDELQLQVTRAWLALLPDREDRDRFALQPYRVHPDLLEQLEVLEPARGPVAAAAAQILSGHVWTQSAPTPARVERDGAPVLRTGDHAVAWRYPLRESDRCLFYWQPASGPTVLARIGPEDLVDLTDAQTPTTPASLALPGPGAVADDVAPAPTAPAVARPRRQRLEVADEDLLRVLRTAGAPMLAPEIRRALGVDPEVHREQLSAVLRDAVDRGLVQRTGQRRGTRYTAS